MALLSARDYTQFPYIEPDFSYEYGEEAHQFAELYLPQTPAPHPVIVLAHGGCYSSIYDLRPMSSLALSLSEDGFAVWNIEYRSAGSGGEFPNMFLDVGGAADYLREIAAERELDLASVMSVGHSAGGHLALWLAARHRLAETSPLYSENALPIAGAVGLAPIADIASAIESGMCGPALVTVTGASALAAAANLADISPIEMLPLGIPQALVVGSEDSLVLSNAQRYHRAATQAEEPIELIEIAAAGHFEVVAVDASAWRAVRNAITSLYTSIQDKLP